MVSFPKKKPPRLNRIARAQLAWGSVFGDQEFISSVVPELGGMLSGHGISKVCSDGPVIKRMRDLVGVGNLESAGLFSRASLSLFYSLGKLQNLFATFIFCVCVIMTRLKLGINVK